MKTFWLQCLSITAFVFMMMWGVSQITDFKLFNAFDPISQALTDFEMTDYSFSNLRSNPDAEQRIVVVNIGTLNRREVAQQLNIIRQFKPKVIGIDGFYNCEGRLRDSINCPQLLDTLGNLMLEDAIKQAGNVVLVSKLMQKTKTSLNSEAIDVYDSMEYSDIGFSLFAKHGFANLVTDPPAVYQEDVKQCRSFIPNYKMYDEDHYAFAVQMCMQFDSAKTKRFLIRNKEEEFINYRGNVEFQNIRLKTLHDKETATTNFNNRFSALDVDQLFNYEFDSSLFKDKIVIMGFLGEAFGDPAWDDKYFTPLNKKVAGRANPDMFGVVIHANIASMILNEDYVNALHEWQKYVIAFMVCFLTVALFITIDRKLPAWFDTLSVTIQILQILAISGLVVYFFAIFTFKLDLTVTLAAAALVGPSYDIYKGFKNQITIWQYKRKLTKTENEVLTE